MKPTHTLISLTLAPRPENMHCYVVSNDKRAVLRASDRMLEELKQRGIDVMIPVVLATPLTGKYIKQVQQEFSKVSPEITECIRTMKDQHLSIVGCSRAVRLIRR